MDSKRSFPVEDTMQKDELGPDIEAVVSNSQAHVSDANGHLKRGLKERHVQFIAIGGTIGVGLFLNIGSALATGGPLSLFLGYCFTSFGIWAMVRRNQVPALSWYELATNMFCTQKMQCVGEMASLLPLPGMIAQSCARFVDPALGFAVGWNQWYNCAIAIAGETSGAVLLIQFWTDINVCYPYNPV